MSGAWTFTGTKPSRTRAPRERAAFLGPAPQL